MTWNTITTQITGHTVTAAEWNDIGENMLFLEEVAYGQATADVTVSATTAATGNEVVTAGAVSYEAVPHLIEFYASRVALPANSGATLICNLFDGSTDMGRIYESSNNAATAISHPVGGQHRLTPTAASHTYRILAWRAVANCTINAGAGGADPIRLPAFIRVTRIPT